MSQNIELLRHFRDGRTLTSAEAIVRFSCERLAARVSELRRAGWDIQGTLTECHDGKRRVVYSLNKRQTVAGAAGRYGADAEQIVASNITLPTALSAAA